MCLLSRKGNAGGKSKTSSLISKNAPKHVHDDLAEQDDRGYYRILCRSVDQLNIRGKKFNPVSLESQLLKHITTLEACAVFGNHELNCVYVGDCEPEQIQQFLFELDRHLRLASLTQVDTIPVPASGKISRIFLKQKFNSK
jgi:acyl-coenzyme A synthetase/AMP-(fatty) acid ligase